MEDLAIVIRNVTNRSASNAIAPMQSRFAPSAAPARRPNTATDLTSLSSAVSSSQDGPRRVTSFFGPWWPSSDCPREYEGCSSNLARCPAMRLASCQMRGRATDSAEINEHAGRPPSARSTRSVAD
eukprot:862243-Pyramimonas_sp.AAC.1